MCSTTILVTLSMTCAAGPLGNVGHTARRVFLLQQAARDPPRLPGTVIVGAGLPGIAAAYRLSTQCPGKSRAILETR